MTFNADEYLKALSPPSIVIDGKTYTGKLLSFDALLPFQEQFELIGEGKASLTEMRDLAAEMCKAMELPAEKIMALPYGGTMAAVAEFLQSHLAVEKTTPASSQVED